jgi:hypothetical protein
MNRSGIAVEKGNNATRYYFEKEGVESLWH